MNELVVMLANLKAAKCPEDVFGHIAAATAEELYKSVQRNYRLMAKSCHEDKFTEPQDKEEAKVAFQILSEFWSQAEERIKSGVYGTTSKSAPKAPDKTSPTVNFKTKKNSYVMGELLHAGGMCGIFDGTVQDLKSNTMPAIFKVPHSVGDNDLLEREAKVLKLFQQKIRELSEKPETEGAAKGFSQRLPTFLESIKLVQPSGEEKVINTFIKKPGYETGWVTLEEIRQAYPEGVNTRVMVFIWNRILEGLSFAHLVGVRHCAITPNHVLIHPESHLGQIIDWTASCIDGAKVPYIDDRYKSFFPEEILDPNGMPSPSSDIFMSAWCMVYILGGDPKTGVIPASVEKPLQDLLNKCLQPKRRFRPGSAEILHGELKQAAKTLFGPSKFVQFVVPSGTASV
ncbi:MAG: hypothetical protein WCF94_00770 [bacterium]